jgi:hypothetical protein
LLGREEREEPELLAVKCGRRSRLRRSASSVEGARGRGEEGTEGRDGGVEERFMIIDFREGDDVRGLVGGSGEAASEREECSA